MLQIRLIVVVVIALLVGLLASQFFQAGSFTGQANRHLQNSLPPITVFCAASNRAVFEDVRKAYESEYKRPVQVQYGPSQQLLSAIEISGSGDLFLPADQTYIETAEKKGLVRRMLPVASMRVGIAVPKGNPRDIRAFADLLKSDLRLVQANPDAAAIGSVTRAALREQNLWQSLHLATDGYRMTVTDVANDLLIGAADAGIVYDAVLNTYPKLEFVVVPELAQVESRIEVALIASSAQNLAAWNFCKYLTSSDGGLRHYRRHGFCVDPERTF